MTLSADLWSANQDLARANLQHPFVQGLADGSLARERFAYYVSQDAFFLKAFARGYVIAGAKAPDWEGFCALHLLAKGVLDELKLHTVYAADWGVDVDDVKPAAATRHYTDFLLTTAWSHDTGLTVVALTPCMRLYAFLGRQLALDQSAPHPYTNWIETYSSQEIEDLALELERLTDQYNSDTALVRDTYRYAMQCELAFFQAAFDHLD